MAEQVPYGVATSLINTLASLAFTEIASIYGVEDDIERLKETVEAIKAVLVDADQKQQNDELIKLWIRKLKQVLYEADDLLDELHTQHLLHMRDGKGKVRDFFSSSNPIAFRLKIAQNIPKIRKQFNDIAEDVARLNLDRGVVVMGHGESNLRETSSFVYHEDIIGREENRKDIIELLLNSNNGNQNAFLVAIVGIGGLGKTTLAQLVFNDARVKNFFTKQMWVCVSEVFDVKELVKKILKSLVGRIKDDHSLESLQYKLQQKLSGQNFLLVLDDIWNEDGEKWQHLRQYLMCGVEGSRILLTTRHQSVANNMGVRMPYVLRGLTNDQSWTLLKRLAFDNNKVITQNLKSIGKKIAKKCAGVPLGIRVIGRLLQSKSNERDWEAILKGDFWKKLSENNDSIMPILKLSYDSLTIELKQCLAYCSLYPKDWTYEKDSLIELWMAQGFLGCQEEQQCLEDVGEEYIHILLMKSFFQDVEMNEYGEIQYFKMHDLMHDLSQLVAGSDYCSNFEDRKNVTSSPMHVSFEQHNSNCSLDMMGASRLRTILKTNKVSGMSDPSNLLKSRRLRGLDLSLYKMRDMPESIGKMNHLRYLDLSYCLSLISLPKSISNLVNLQTLKLRGCSNMKFSIDIVTKLINLRRLDIENCEAFEDGMPIGLCKMTTLQSLSNFVVGNDDKKRKKAKLNELQELNLRGTLVIKNLGLVKEVKEESKDVNLKAKKNLMSLTLDWGHIIEVENGDTLQLLRNLRPHPNLKELNVHDYSGERLSNWLLSLRNLVELTISGCRSCEYLPVLEGLISLKTLCISSMDALKYICYERCSSSMAKDTTSFYPSLEDLSVSFCKRLRGWKRETDVKNSGRDNEKHHSLPPFSCLSSLKISHCPNLTCMPTFPNLARQLEFSNSNTEPLLGTLKMSRTGPSTPKELDASYSLSMLKYLCIEEIDMNAFPDEWMQNFTSLQHLSIKRLSSPEKLFHQMQHLSATLEQLSISNIDKLHSLRAKDLRCLHSLKRIEFEWILKLKALPEWICDLQSLRSIFISDCESLKSLPTRMRCCLNNLHSLHLSGEDMPLMKRCKRETGAEWPNIAHIPNVVLDFRNSERANF
ncbi:putative disease resistance protein RGA1 [Prosopis cineraria]|uniref:putative disease resistance protein RGA1 n=1 Tax=Prosopis cineraria TaxID=364024 RepID=UPI00241086AB|nr:putative disease resistance protein RGA1 [Prosopis cineraria]